MILPLVLLAVLSNPARAYCPAAGETPSCPDSSYVLCSLHGGQVCGNGRPGWTCYRASSCPCGTRALTPQEAGGGGYAFSEGGATVPSAPCAGEGLENPVTRAFSSCDRMRAACSQQDTDAAIAALGSTDFCLTRRTDSAAAGRFRDGVCGDPAGFVCANHGRIVDSQCRVSTFSLDEFALTPEAVQVSCEMWQARIGALTSGQEACRADRASEACRQAQLDRWDETRQAERDAVYTASRRQKATDFLDRVRTEYVNLIQGSTLIPDAQKQALVDELNRTVLSNDGGLCSNTDLEKSRWATGAYFWQGSPNNTIEVCLGTMGNIDRMNPYALMWTLAHELSHSIDPCRLEELGLAADPSRGTPHRVDTVFPGLARCLRGGTGTRGCTNAVIHCNGASASDRRDSCVDDLSRRPRVGMGGGDRGDRAPAIPETEIQACLDRLERTPNCHIRASGRDMSQLPESFSDFMGAEVMGRLIAADAASGALDEQGRLDALTSIAGANGSGEDDDCDSSNDYQVSDRYPRGHTRLNRLVMGSRAFRSSLGCPADSPPTTADAGATCSGF